MVTFQLADGPGGGHQSYRLLHTMVSDIEEFATFLGRPYFTIIFKTKQDLVVSSGTPRCSSLGDGHLQVGDDPGSDSGALSVWGQADLHVSA